MATHVESLIKWRTKVRPTIVWIEAIARNKIHAYGIPLLFPLETRYLVLNLIADGWKLIALSVLGFASLYPTYDLGTTL